MSSIDNIMQFKKLVKATFNVFLGFNKQVGVVHFFFSISREVLFSHGTLPLFIPYGS